MCGVPAALFEGTLATVGPLVEWAGPTTRESESTTSTGSGFIFKPDNPEDEGGSFLTRGSFLFVAAAVDARGMFEAEDAVNGGA